MNLDEIQMKFRQKKIPKKLQTNLDKINTKFRTPLGSAVFSKFRLNSAKIR
jgi:hypothetical protein